MLRRAARQEKQSWTHTGRIGTADPGLQFDSSEGKQNVASFSVIACRMPLSFSMSCLRIRHSSRCSVNSSSSPLYVMNRPTSCAAFSTQSISCSFARPTSPRPGTGLLSKVSCHDICFDWKAAMTFVVPAAVPRKEFLDWCE